MDFELLECFQFLVHILIFSCHFACYAIWQKRNHHHTHHTRSPAVLIHTFFLNKTEFLLLLLLCLPDWSLALSWGSSFSLLPALQKSWSWQHEITKCDSFFRHHTGFSGGKLYSVGRHLFIYICKIINLFK